MRYLWARSYFSVNICSSLESIEATGVLSTRAVAMNFWVVKYKINGPSGRGIYITRAQHMCARESEGMLPRKILDF